LTQPALTFDTALLPQSPLLDTTVWLRAFGWQSDQDTVLCSEFVAAMLGQQRKMMMAAPTLSELIRGDASRVIPHTSKIVLVAFDRVAATKLGSIATRDWLTTVSGLKTAIKFDCLIAACAVRGNADSLVSLDAAGPMVKIAQAFGLRLVHPRELVGPLQTQTSVAPIAPSA
jgi:predicted nucleic acid-binding protein